MDCSKLIYGVGLPKAYFLDEIMDVSNAILTLFLTLAILGLAFFLLMKNKIFPKVKITFRITIGENEKSSSIQQSSLVPEKHKEIAIGMAKLESKLFFLEKGITLREVASRLKTNEKYVSWFLKKNYNTSYTHYLNGLRVDYFMERLETDSDFAKKFTLESIAQQCGFASNKSLSKACERKIGKTSSKIVREIINQDNGT